MLPFPKYTTLTQGADRSQVPDAGTPAEAGFPKFERAKLANGLEVFLVERHFAWAFGVYLFAALTDVLDGWIACRWNQTTVLGTALDPLVDIVFNLTTLGGLAGLRVWI